MTDLNRRIVRRTSTPAGLGRYRDRPIVISLEPPGSVIGLRIAGTKTTHYLPVAIAFQRAVEITIARELAARKTARDEKRKLEKRAKHAE